MNEEQAKALREPFPPDLIGKLPRIWCKACRESRSKVCSDHTKSRCPECKNNITSAHLHLDYVGHAAVTDRLLSVDPGWSWEPLARDPSGAPVITENKGGPSDSEPLGLWGYLKVCDVTKPAFGGGKNAKECISDLIRNGAMRFGVGLDLWSKEDLHYDEASSSTGEVGKPQSHESPAEPHRPSQAPSPVETPEQQREKVTRWMEREGDASAIAASIRDAVGNLENLDHLHLMAEIEGGREMRTGGKKKPRKTVIDAIAKRILELGGKTEGDPSSGNSEDDSLTPKDGQDDTGDPASPYSEFTPLAEPEQTQEPVAAGSESRVDLPSPVPGSSEDVFPGNASGSANGTLLKLKAALAFIQDQPASVDNPKAWTKSNILFALSQKNPENTFGTLEEVPPPLLDAIWGFIPDEVKASVELYGPEALDSEAAKAK